MSSTNSPAPSVRNSALIWRIRATRKGVSASAARDSVQRRNASIGHGLAVYARKESAEIRNRTGQTRHLRLECGQIAAPHARRRTRSRDVQPARPQLLGLLDVLQQVRGRPIGFARQRPDATQRRAVCRARHRCPETGEQRLCGRKGSRQNTGRLGEDLQINPPDKLVEIGHQRNAFDDLGNRRPFREPHVSQRRAGTVDHGSDAAHDLGRAIVGALRRCWVIKNRVSPGTRIATGEEAWKSRSLLRGEP